MVASKAVRAASSARSSAGRSRTHSPSRRASHATGGGSVASASALDEPSTFAGALTSLSEAAPTEAAAEAKERVSASGMGVAQFRGGGVRGAPRGAPTAQGGGGGARVPALFTAGSHAEQQCNNGAPRRGGGLASCRRSAGPRAHQTVGRHALAGFTCRAPAIAKIALAAAGARASGRSLGHSGVSVGVGPTTSSPADRKIKRGRPRTTARRTRLGWLWRSADGAPRSGSFDALSGSNDTTVKLFNVNDGAVLRTFKHTHTVNSGAAPDGLRFVSGSDDDTA